MRRQRAACAGPRLEQISLENAGVRLSGRWVLRDVAFDVRAGENWLLLGANGAGKTLLLRLLRGEIWPTPTGRERRRYLVDGEWQDQPLVARGRIAYLGPEQQDRYERRGWNATLAETVATGLFDTVIPLDALTAAHRQSVRRSLEQVGRAGRAQRRFLSLSQGQRRRVLLARALVCRPDVLLLDEASMLARAMPCSPTFRFIARAGASSIASTGSCATASTDAWSGRMARASRR